MALKTEAEKIAHLLRRFGLGASEAEVAYYSPGGLKGAINRLLDYESVDEGFPVKPEDFANDQGQLNLRAAQAFWYMRILCTQRPLEQKMTIFWHDHFATSAQKVDSPLVMLGHIEVLRQNCLGPFLHLLTAVSKDPAMLYWLDNQENIKGKPNENFAREIMELFTLGFGNYSEKDIQEAARAFTGWTIGVQRGMRVVPIRRGLPRRDATFCNDIPNHDTGEKQILGNRGTFDGEDTIGILCGNPQTARFITLKMWEFFAYPNPEPALIDRLAAGWRAKGMVIKDLVRTIMESDEFYSSKAEKSLIKNPVDFCFATSRQLGIGQLALQRMSAGAQTGLRAAGGTIQPIIQASKAMGMELMYPPDVDGWVSGQGWISTATMVERIKWADRLFPASGRTAAGVPIGGLFAADPTAAGVTKKLISVFDAHLPPEKENQILKAAEKAMASGPAARTIPAAANAAARLIFGSPEFQFL